MTTKIRNEHRAAWKDGRLYDVPESVRPLLEKSDLQFASGTEYRIGPETEKPHLEKQEDEE